MKHMYAILHARHCKKYYIQRSRGTCMDILLEFNEDLLSYDGKKLGMFIIG